MVKKKKQKQRSEAQANCIQPFGCCRVHFKSFSHVVLSFFCSFRLLLLELHKNRRQYCRRRAFIISAHHYQHQHFVTIHLVYNPFFQHSHFATLSPLTEAATKTRTHCSFLFTQLWLPLLQQRICLMLLIDFQNRRPMTTLLGSQSSLVRAKHGLTHTYVHTFILPFTQNLVRKKRTRTLCFLYALLLLLLLRYTCRFNLFICGMLPQLHAEATTTTFYFTYSTTTTMFRYKEPKPLRNLSTFHSRTTFPLHHFKAAITTTNVTWNRQSAAKVTTTTAVFTAAALVHQRIFGLSLVVLQPSVEIGWMNEWVSGWMSEWVSGRHLKSTSSVPLVTNGISLLRLFTPIPGQMHVRAHT